MAGTRGTLSQESRNARAQEAAASRAAHRGRPLLQLSIKTLRRYGVAGKITLYRNGEKLILVDLDELDRLVRPIAAGR